MRIVIGNLPGDVTEDSSREALKPFAPVENIKLVKDSGAPRRAGEDRRIEWGN